MAEKQVRLHILKCGSITVSPETAYGGKTAMTGMTAASLTPLRNRITLPVFAYLIEHPKGRILVDTGWPREISPNGVYDEKAARKTVTPFLTAFYHPQVGPGETVSEQLAAMGIAPRDLDYVLITHLDPDHVSGLGSLQGAKKVLFAEDEYFWSCRTVYKLRQPTRLWMQYPAEHFWYRGTPLGPVKWSYDVFGDESVIIINCPGHTDGMGVVMIRSGSRFAVLAADTAFSPKNWQDLVVPGFCFDEKRALLSLKWLKEQAEDPNCAGVFCSHDAGIQPQTVII